MHKESIWSTWAIHWWQIESTIRWVLGTRSGAPDCLSAAEAQHGAATLCDRLGMLHLVPKNDDRTYVDDRQKQIICLWFTPHFFDLAFLVVFLFLAELRFLHAYEVWINETGAVIPWVIPVI